MRTLSFLIFLTFSLALFSQENTNLLICLKKPLTLDRQGHIHLYPLDTNNLDEQIRFDWTVPNGDHSINLLTPEDCTLNSTGTEASTTRRAWGQSFSPDCSGNLSSITFEATSTLASSATFRVYNGADCSGTVLATRSLASIASGDNVVDLATDNVYLDQALTYYFDIVSDNNADWRIRYSNIDNTPGVLRCNDGAGNCGQTFANFDMDFSVALVDQAATTVTCGTGQLKITLSNSGSGVSVQSIQNGATEILNNNSELFSLDIRTIANSALTTISSTANWGTAGITLSNGNNDCTITLSNPNLANVPASLVATATIHTNGSKSEWDLSVTGVGANHSFMDASFPHLNILGNGGQFLTPQFSGQLFADPANAGINYSGFYPRGNGTNMQFMAYYGAGSDIYFGFHDPTAAYKRFLARDENGGVNVECQLPIPDKTLAENDWDFPGHFELDLFSGDWYGAAMIYKDWASNNADYWPTNTAARAARQAEIGKIGVWFNDIGYYQGQARTAAQIQSGTQICIDEMPAGIPIGTHLYSWNGKPMDKDFPELFPSVIDGIETSIETLQNHGATIMPYFNGYLYDQGIDSYAGTGLPNIAQSITGGAYTQTPANDIMSIMCPATTTWQDILEGAASDVSTILNTECIYLDQVSAAAGQQCYNPNHGHTLGGGTYWRDGYKIALQHIHANANTSAGFFVTTEGACDYLLDEVDGCLVDPWDHGHLVPAYPAIYSGRVQLFGTSVGTNYTSDAFYTQLSQSFSFGIQPGRLTTWIMNDANTNSQAEAKPFVIQLGTMRYKLREFMSFGEMHYPPAVTPITPNVIPTITSDWDDGGGTRMVTISSLQSSLWQKGDSIAFVFVNASRTEDILNFDFDVIGSQYGLAGDLLVREVTQNSDGTYATVNNSFTQNVTLGALEIKAYIIKAANPLPISMVSFSGYKRGQAVALKWETASEVNFKGFGIERSQDGVHWETLDFVQSKGNSLAQNDYQYLDSTPNQGINYYRLKEMDMDGDFKYSNTISVHFERGDINIYPNPTHGTINIKSKDILIDKVLIYNQLGQIVFTSNSSNNLLDISILPKGMYTVMVQSKSNLFKQIIILE